MTRGDVVFDEFLCICNLFCSTFFDPSLSVGDC